MIRILSAEDEVVIDVRSTSRVGLSDLGANAKRIRNLLDEIETRLGKGA
jgi:fatty-acyl-CoA synthase